MSDEWVKRRVSNEHYHEILMKMINMIPKGKYDFVYGIPRGGLIPATWMAYYLNVQIMLEYGMHIPIDKVLIVDDIADTGITLEPFVDAGYDTACLFWKSRSSVKPTYHVYETDQWIIFPYEKDDEPINREL